MKHSLLFLFLVFFSSAFHNGLKAQWIRANGPFSGVINVVAASGNTVAAHSNNIGLFLSSDEAKNWNALSNEQLSNWITSILIHGDRILLGESDAGLFISTNNGSSWGKYFSGLDTYTGIEALAENGTTIFAGGNMGLFQSMDDGSDWTKIEVDSPGSPVLSIAARDSLLILGTESGIYVSPDKGLTWRHSTNGLPEKATAKVAINGSILFAAINGYGIYISADSGLTWNGENNGLTSQPYFNSIISFDNIVLAATGSEGVFKWTNNASAWQSANKGLPEKIAVNSMASSGSNIYAGTYGLGVFLSTDGGSTWSKSNDGLSGFWISSTASRGDSIFIGTSYCGIYFAEASLMNWKFLNVPGFNQYYFGDIAFDSKNIYVAAGQDGILRSTDNGLSWETANNGIDRFSEGISAIHAHKDKMFAATYASPGFPGKLYYSTNNGSSWQKVAFETSDFPATVSMASNGSDIFAVAQGRVYLSTDDGKVWHLTNSGLEGKEVTRIKAKDNVAFIATLRDGAFRSTDKGSSWTSVTGELAGKQATSFAFWASSIVFAGTYGNGVYVSTDNGLSWQQAGSNLPQKNIIWIEKNGEYLFAASETTLWRAAISEIAPLLLPSVPKLLSVENNSKNQPLSLIRLSWQKAENAEWYHLQLSKDSLFKDVALEDSAITLLTKDITELNEGRIYFWRLRAGNGVGVSPWSEVWNFTTVLNRPDSLSLSAMTKGIKITWKDNSSNETGFIIERMLSENFSALDTVKANAVTYLDSTAVQPDYYHYRIKSFNQFAVSSYSDTASIILTYTESARTGPTEYFLFQNYPNPFNPVTLIRYNLPLESSVRLAVYNPLGKILKEFVFKNQASGAHEISFDAKGIASGAYFYIFEARADDGTKEFRQIKKMIILK
ncbi:MAG: T9SS type A sorting domain-containing protein [Ignavibacteria bacterium]|nr:T9SS type A sorting domain-containing protein [Ignavibacteria bacterium]MCU7502907.1 T9SS type A sorting domain-containing protein [Ignavibacteria bacterium]MCU7515599.1 T9SS type A sorting domain-containing protein [Ignavibacteria bacterium]